MKYYSSGKLLLTSEYMVLRGAKAISLPTIPGQTLTVNESDNGQITWQSLDIDGLLWFEAVYSINHLDIISSSNDAIANRLQKLLKHAEKYSKKPIFNEGTKIKTSLQFDRQWGLGSSSTLVSNLAKYAEIDPIKLLHSAFKGSGYDVATGFENHSILYSIIDQKPQWELINFNPSFANHLFFVHLNQKQLSEKEVTQFDKLAIHNNDVAFFNDVTDNILNVETLETFESLLHEHENRLSGILKRPTIKQLLFTDYPKTIKSLGAWGGDFVLATGTKSDQEYFKNKGYQTIMDYTSLIDSK